MDPKGIDVANIADQLLCGMVCFLHRTTGEIEEYRQIVEEEEEYAEFWQDVMDKIKKNRSSYMRIEPMEPSQSFRVMRDFALQLEDIGMQGRLFKALQERKPFRNFSFVVENSEHRQEWFDFRLKRNEEWVKEQLWEILDEEE